MSEKDSSVKNHLVAPPFGLVGLGIGVTLAAAALFKAGVAIGRAVF